MITREEMEKKLIEEFVEYLQTLDFKAIERLYRTQDWRKKYLTN